MVNSPVIFFDGYCGLCNGFVDFVMARDTQKKFRYATIQGRLAQTVLTDEERENLDSVIVLIDQIKSRKSQAVLHVFKELGGGWRVLSWFGILPTPFLDFFYDLVAQNRYRLFGKRESCRLPTPEERALFLD